MSRADVERWKRELDGGGFSTDEDADDDANYRGSMLPDLPGGTSSDEDDIAPRAFSHSSRPKASKNPNATSATSGAPGYRPGGAIGRGAATGGKGQSRSEARGKGTKGGDAEAPRGVLSGGTGPFGGFDSMEEFNMALMVRIEMLETDLARTRAEARSLRHSAAGDTAAGGPRGGGGKGAKGGAAGAGASSLPAGVAEYAKKVRSLTHALGKERGRAAVLERERDQWRTAFEREKGNSSGKAPGKRPPRSSASSASSASAASAASSASSTSSASSVSSASTQQQTSVPASVVADLKAQLEIARTEVVRAQRALEREVGDGATVADALAGDAKSRWRGRAEKIALLKEQLRRARARAGDATAPGDGSDAVSTAAGSITGRSVSAATEKQLARIGGIEQNRKLEIDRLMVEAQEQREAYAALKRKCDAAQARAATLEKDARQGRERIAALIKKSKEDDELINTLKDGLREAVSKRNNAEAVSAREAAREAASRDVVPKERHESLKAKYAEMCGRVDTQEQMIESLKRRVDRAGARSRSPPAALASADSAEGAREFDSLPPPVAGAVRAFAGGEIDALELRVESLEDVIAHLRAQVSEAEEREADASLRAKSAERAAAKAAAGSTKRQQRPDQHTLEDRCEMLQDEVASLKLSLRGTAQRREKELAMYRDMVEEHRRMCEQRLADFVGNS